MMDNFYSFIHDGRFVAGVLTSTAAAMLIFVGVALESVCSHNEITPSQPKARYITQETEDALKPGTLDALLGHYNFAIRETAAKIICDRAVNDPETVQFLLYGITRPNYEERFRSLRTLALITDHSHLYTLNTPKAYSALVRCLELCLDESPSELLNDPYHDDYYLRDMAEKFCLMFIVQLINNYGTEALVTARFVEKWLARQPWGEGDMRQRNFSQYLDRRQNRISDICMRLKATHSGSRALTRAGLMPSWGAPPPDAWGDVPPGWVPPEEGARLSLVLTTPGGGGEALEADEVERSQPRVFEQSAEEQRMRRQHREAMVLNDGTRPLGRGDIIERDHGAMVVE